MYKLKKVLWLLKVLMVIGKMYLTLLKWREMKAINRKKKETQ